MLLSSCGFTKPPRITDEDIDRYLRVYAAVEKTDPAFAERLIFPAGGNIFGPASPKADAIVKSVTDNGFADYNDFVRVNLTIASALSRDSAREFMQGMDQASQRNEEHTQELLKASNLPEDAKASIRAAREQARAIEEANRRASREAITRRENAIDSESLEVVERHKAEIEHAYATIMLARQKRNEDLLERAQTGRGGYVPSGSCDYSASGICVDLYLLPGQPASDASACSGGGRFSQGQCSCVNVVGTCTPAQKMHGVRLFYSPTFRSESASAACPVRGGYTFSPVCLL